MSEDLIDTAPRTVPSVLPHRASDLHGDDSDAPSDGELFEELEEDEEGFDWGGFREKRMEQLKEDALRIELAKTTLHGRYTEMKNEKEIIVTASKEPWCVIHFFHRDFRRCKIMDKHLESIAPHHPRTLFLRVEVSNVPWLVEKMQIKVLPAVLCFIGGMAKDKIVGFEGLTMDAKADDFKTGALERRLKESGAIPAPNAPIPNAQPPAFNFTNTTFASGGGGPRGIRQGDASRRKGGRGRGSDEEESD